MIRTVNISLDDQSWPAPGAPDELQALAGDRETNLLAVLVHTALWTRPPEITGFHLADFWAFFRYAPAISESQRLRLRPEWATIDPHQKTILSDELGVGFTTELLATELGIIHFADTLHWARSVAPEQFQIGGSSRIGSGKSPDYLGVDNEGRYCILECKGTQTSHRVQLRAMDRGVEQKANLEAQNPATIRFSLVAGLFIPQFESREEARIHIRDPEWEKLQSLLNEEIARDVGAAGITQIVLAKHFAIMGLTRMSGFLAKRKLVSGRGSLPREARRDLEMLDEADLAATVNFATSSLRLQAPHIESSVRRFSMKAPADLVEEILGSQDLTSTMLSISNSRKKSWRSKRGKSWFELTTPLGFTFRLDLGI